MDQLQNQTGYFLFSLDTELGWGFFDYDHARSINISPDGSRERRMIARLLEVFDEFEITVTWAITGHLFYKECEMCDFCPILEWQDKYHSFEEIYKTDNPQWYGADIIKSLNTQGSRHEIGFHGYTHQLFDESTMDARHARDEIQEWLRVSRRIGIVPRTVVFPRNVIGYLKIFQDHGFVCYRGKEIQPSFYRLPYAGKLIKHIDQIAPFSAPYIYDVSDCKINNGMVDLSATQDFFGFNRRLELFLDSIHLSRIRFGRMIKAIKKAATQKKIIHICAHPWEFRGDEDIDKLRYVLGYVADEIGKGRLISLGMAELADKVKIVKYAFDTLHPAN